MTLYGATAIFSSIVVVVCSITMIVIGRKNAKYKRVYKDIKNIKFLGKNISGKMHSRYSFIIDGQGVQTTRISVIDKTGLDIEILNPNGNLEMIKCNSKNINKYKHAKLLLDHLNQEIKNWGL